MRRLLTSLKLLKSFADTCLASSCVDPQLSSSVIDSYRSLSYQNDDEIFTNEISAKECLCGNKKIKDGKISWA